MPNFTVVKTNCVKSNDELAFMNISLLSKSIMSEMNYQDNNYIVKKLCTQYNRIYDYIFLCFFLGNDFLPHFPALNIRTSGIQVLIDTYKLHISNFTKQGLEEGLERGFIKSNTNGSYSIEWKWVFLFISELAKMEHSLFINETNNRNNFDYRKWAQTTDADKKQLVLNIPIIYRAEEKYICPLQPFWEDRYYSSLFTDPNIIVSSVCRNYMEGLEWVFKYYTVDCPHWRWKYNYNYPPLLTDLSDYISTCDFTGSFITNIPYKNEPFLPNIQLSYVIPYKFHYLLDSKTRLCIQKNIENINKPNFQWAYCRYFWESHILLPEISIELLDEWTNNLID